MKKKLIYLTMHMGSYKASHYQIDVIEELARQADVYFYGLDYPDYSPQDSIADVVAKAGFTPDAIIVGHSWLRDIEGQTNFHEHIDLTKTKIPKIAILNKEYVNLPAKLAFIQEIGAIYAFTHHHDVETYSRETGGIPFEFWPFAVNPARLSHVDLNGPRDIDVGFAGILQNQNTHADQTDLRYRIMHRFFFDVFDIPVRKRARYQNLNVFWVSIPRKRLHQKIATLLKVKKFLPPHEFYQVLGRSKIFLNSFSPMQLVGPRYYDIMAAKSMLFCIKTDLYDRIFRKRCFVEFSPDLSDFDEKLFYYLEHDKERQALVDEAYDMVLRDHTWKVRVERILAQVP